MNNRLISLKLLPVILSLLWAIQATAASTANKPSVAAPKSAQLATRVAKKDGAAKRLSDKKSANKSAKKVDKKTTDQKLANRAAVSKKQTDKKVTETKSPKQAAKKSVGKKSVKAHRVSRHIPREHLYKISRRHGIDPLLVKAIIKIESGGRPNARSHKGAVGLMQVMPATARQYGNYNLKDPKQNITVGVRHFAELKKRYKNTKIALAAYNAGGGNVDKYGGIPPFGETKRYVRNIMVVYQKFKKDGRLA